MAYNKVNKIIIENAEILWPNFRGIAGQYNDEGSRSFCVKLSDKDRAEKWRNEGWNVRTYPKNPTPDDDWFYYIQVKVRFNDYPPEIHLYKNVGGKRIDTQLTEETVGRLDTADIENVDVMIRPYSYDVNGKTGISAYLDELYVTVESNPLADKYAEDQEEDESIPFV